LEVREAEHGRILHPGHVYLAPGNRHLRLARGTSGFVTHVADDPQFNGHRPAVDHLFVSVADLAGNSAIGVILSGMGADGAAGLLKMRKAGAMTFGQDAATCVVYGMPRAAFELGAVAKQVPLEKVSSEIMAHLRSLDKPAASKPR
jgi:two-component system chemotaxis response regulator CheB